MIAWRMINFLFKKSVKKVRIWVYQDSDYIQKIFIFYFYKRISFEQKNIKTHEIYIDLWKSKDIKIEKKKRRKI